METLFLSLTVIFLSFNRGTCLSLSTSFWLGLYLLVIHLKLYNLLLISSTGILFSLATVYMMYYHFQLAYKPIHLAVSRSIDQSNVPSINWSIYQSTNRSSNQPTNPLIGRSINQPTNPSIDRSINQPNKPSADWSIHESVNEWSISSKIMLNQ